MGAKFIMQYIAKVSGGGPNVQVRGGISLSDFNGNLINCQYYLLPCVNRQASSKTGFANF